MGFLEITAELVETVGAAGGEREVEAVPGIDPGEG
jgi:hypothetical protein